MGKTLLNKLYITLYFVLGSVVLEFVNFVVLDFGFFPQYYFYDLLIILFIAMIIFILPHYITQYVFATIMLAIQSLLIYANYSLYMIYTGDLFSFDMFNLLGEAMAAATSGFVYFSIICQVLLIFLFIGSIGFLILKHCLKDKFKAKNHFSIASIFIFVGMQILTFGACAGFRGTLSPENYGDKLQDFVFSDSFYMYTDIIKENGYKKFGTYGFYLNMLFNTNHSQTDTIQHAAIDYFDKGDIYSSSQVFGVDKGKNVIVIMMESLEWFALENGDYNFPASQFSNELTPNIYRLITGKYVDADGQNQTDKQGIIATNFFAKSKTNISESYGILGNFPVGQNLQSILKNGTSQDFGYALPNVLKQNGYITNYVHSNTIEFYGRDKTHEKLGFDKLTGKDSILDENGKQKYTDLDFHHWLCEEDFVMDAMDSIVPKQADEKTYGQDKQKFYTFYLNVSSHGGYTDNEHNQDQVRYKNYIMYGEDDCILNDDGAWVLDSEKSEPTYTNWYKNVLKNYGTKSGEEFVENELTNQLVNYMSGVKGLDAAIGKIVAQLEEYGILDDTIMMLYADHYAYYDSLSNRIKNIQSAVDSQHIELNTLPFVLVSPGLNSMQNVPYTNKGEGYTYMDAFCSAYDIIPTLLDLLGIKFNQRFYLGDSLFSPIRTTYRAEVDGVQQIHTMKVYYSNIGGIYCQDLITSNFEDFIAQSKVDNQTLIDFINQASEKIINVYYLDVLNNNLLYTKLSNAF